MGFTKGCTNNNKTCCMIKEKILYRSLIRHWPFGSTSCWSPWRALAAPSTPCFGPRNVRPQTAGLSVEIKTRCGSRPWSLTWSGACGARGQHSHISCSAAALEFWLTWWDWKWQCTCSSARRERRTPRTSASSSGGWEPATKQPSERETAPQPE